MRIRRFPRANPPMTQTTEIWNERTYDVRLSISELKDLYAAQGRITVALPSICKAARSSETREQVQRLDHIFQVLGEDQGGRIKCAH
jgi:ferritin-like metal-binding protein YciE